MPHLFSHTPPPTCTYIGRHTTYIFLNHFRVNYMHYALYTLIHQCLFPKNEDIFLCKNSAFRSVNSDVLFFFTVHQSTWWRCFPLVQNPFLEYILLDVAFCLSFTLLWSSSSTFLVFYPMHVFHAYIPGILYSVSQLGFVWYLFILGFSWCVFR